MKLSVQNNNIISHFNTFEMAIGKSGILRVCVHVQHLSWLVSRIPHHNPHQIRGQSSYNSKEWGFCNPILIHCKLSEMSVICHVKKPRISAGDDTGANSHAHLQGNMLCKHTLTIWRVCSWRMEKENQMSKKCCFHYLYFSVREIYI